MTDDKILMMLPRMFFPGTVYVGQNSLFYLRTLHGKTLAVVSKSVWKNHEERLRRFLPTDCKFIFRHGEPKKEDMDSLHSEIESGKYDNVLGIGGGSVLDLAKTSRLKKADTNLVLVPTTSGTGAEVSRYAVITENGEKKPITSEKFVPGAVLLDPTFSLTLPKFETIYNTLDILSSVIEALVSKLANPLSDTLSLVCIDNVIPALRSVCSDLQDMEARGKLQITGFLNGLVLGSSPVGLVHAFAHYFGARLNLPHGLAVGTCMMPVISHSVKKTDRYEKLQASRRLRGDVMANLSSFMREMGFLDYHKKLDFGNVDVADVCQKIRCDPITKTNPYAVGDDDIKQILSSMGVS